MADSESVSGKTMSVVALCDGETVESLIAFEKDIAELFNAGRIRAPVHFSGGNEEALIRVFAHIGRDDWVIGSWRMHYQCLLKGVPRAQLKADILAGKSIALCYPEYRILSSAIVAGSLSIATGIALGIKRRGGKERVHAFLGDMTASTGLYWEACAFAFGYDLPISFVIEDNGLSVCTPTRVVWNIGRDESVKREGFGTWCQRYTYTLPWPHSGAGIRVQF